MMRFDILSVRGDRPALRFVLLLLVFGLTALAFWWHFERRMAQIAPPHAERFLHDAARIIPTEEARPLHDWRTTFQDSLGLSVLVMVSPDRVQVPDFAPGTLFVGLGLGRSSDNDKAEAIISLPPLARKAMSEGQRLQLEESLAACASAKEAIPSVCLQQTLKSLWQDLGGK